jgi:hypothetical protein
MESSEDMSSYISVPGGRVVAEMMKRMFKSMDCDKIFEIYKKLGDDQSRYGHVVGGMYEMMLEKILIGKSRSLTYNVSDETDVFNCGGYEVRVSDIFKSINGSVEVEILKSVGRVGLRPNVLYCQGSKNWKGLDFLTFYKHSDNLFLLVGIQATVGQKHGINLEAISDISQIVVDYEEKVLLLHKNRGVTRRSTRKKEADVQKGQEEVDKEDEDDVEGDVENEADIQKIPKWNAVKLFYVHLFAVTREEFNPPGGVLRNFETQNVEYKIHKSVVNITKKTVNRMFLFNLASSKLGGALRNLVTGGKKSNQFWEGKKILDKENDFYRGNEEAVGLNKEITMYHISVEFY